MLTFYWRCIRRALTSGWDAANGVSLAVGVVGGFVAWRLPRFRQSVDPLYWLVPVGAFGAWFVFRSIRAPFELYEEANRERQAAESRAATVTAELKEHRNCQAIADYLTEQHEYGVHQLLNKPPTQLSELDEWNRWVDNWNTALFLEMEKRGCTPQDLNQVRTILRSEVLEGLPDVPDVPIGESDMSARIRFSFARQAAEAERQMQIPVRMHAIRLHRVQEVATRYARRAEEVKMAATKRDFGALAS